MRNAFLALVLVNLAYCAWAHWVDAPRPPAVNEALAKLPKLKLAEEVPQSPRPPPPAAEKTVLDQPPACFSVGPFAELGKSAEAAALLRAKGFDPRQRAAAGQTSAGYLVFVGGLKTQAERDHALATLEHNGIRDALVMPETPDAGRRLSLGVYSQRARAEKRAETVRQSGLKAEVAERKAPGSVYWLDLSPLPGMTTIPIQDLFAEAVSSHIAVQTCPAPAQAAVKTPALATPVASQTAPGDARRTHVAGAAKLP